MHPAQTVKFVCMTFTKAICVSQATLPILQATHALDSNGNQKMSNNSLHLTAMALSDGLEWVNNYPSVHINQNSMAIYAANINKMNNGQHVERTKDKSKYLIIKL